LENLSDPFAIQALGHFARNGFVVEIGGQVIGPRPSTLLVQAAAQWSQVDPASCTTAKAEVQHAASVSRPIQPPERLESNFCGGKAAEAGWALLSSIEVRFA